MLEAESLMEKIKGLPHLQQTEVEDFVEFLAQKEDRRFTLGAMKASESSFNKVWDNEEDSVYDQLVYDHYKFGEIILVPFPFTDQSETKKRPVVVVSSTAYN